MKEVGLDRLTPGESGRVGSLQTSKPGIRQRLLEMGLTKGTIVQVIRLAPLGDPIEILVRGYRLSLRKQEAESVMILKREE